VSNVATSNFSKHALLINAPIIVRNDNDETFVFHMPTLKDEVDGILNYNFFYGFCAAHVSDLREQTKAEFDSKYDFLIKAIRTGDANAVSLLGCLTRHIQEFRYVDDLLYCGEFPLDDEIFDLFCIYVAIASGCEKWEALTIREEEKNMSPEEREWERRKRLNQAKINAAKEKAGKGTNFDDMVAAVMFEYGLSPAEVYSLNKFSFVFLYSCIMQIAGYEVSKIAAGTGNLGKNSKHKYWTNK
jgi:hypothetical protein